MPFSGFQVAALVVVVALVASGWTYLLVSSTLQPVQLATTTMTQTSTVTSTTTLIKSAESPSLEVAPLVHAAVMIRLGEYTVYVDPYGMDFSASPKADLILITHPHRDHLSTSIIEALSKDGTKLIAPESATSSLPQAMMIQAGDEMDVDGVKVKAVAAYNLERRNQRGELFHPEGFGVAYVVSIGGKSIFFAGDTECTPEIQSLENIDIAFLPIDGVYTMTPEEAAQCYTDIMPNVAIPYHQNQQDPNQVKDLLASTPSIKVEIYQLP
ncbi:MAG: MBL fold metallo-hydrolase [Nitrososphaerales archaeon]